MTKDGEGEISGRLVVLRDGGALVLGTHREALLSLDPDRLGASGAMDQDTVLARPLKHQKAARLAARATGRRARSTGRGSRPSVPGAAIPGPAAPKAPPGIVVRILERAHPTVVGTFKRDGRHESVTPDDRRLPVTVVRGGSLGAQPGEKVVVAIAGFPRAGDPTPYGPVVERLGAAGDPDAETLAIIRALGLRDTFPPAVAGEADKLPREVRPADADRRLDLTSETIFTIDDADARDLDDAISLGAPRAPGSAWRLGVHIADVSAYARVGSALDREARERGTSVYLADRVLPMFPTALSNGIASLHPGPDRLTLSVFMDIDENGRTVAHEVARSVIRSVARCTYDAVAAVLAPEFGEELGAPPHGKAGAADGSAANAGAGAPAPETATAAQDLPPAVVATLRSMAPLAASLRRRRMDRGSLDFDLSEEKAKLDGQGRPLAVVRRRRNIATQLIEEFMIAANEAVADYLLWNGVAFMRRIHEDPFQDDLEALRETLAPLGYRVPTTRAPRPADLQAILEASRDRPEGPEVHKALLRALPQARYSASPGGHFALASPNYLHFTSPIRRYPDLTVHRAVVAVLEGRAHAEADLEALADWCSRTERVAEKAENESLALMKARLAEAALGDVAEGEVVDVFDFGAFVRLPNGAEGLVGASSGGRDLRLGQRVTVQVVKVDVAKRHVDLVLSSEGAL